MPNNGKVKVGIIGSGFEADIHAESFRLMPEEAEVVAVASPTPGNAEKLAKRYGIPRFFTDYRTMLAEKDIEMVTIAAPNCLHAQMTADIANAGKHVVCEKPLCMTLEEADAMIDAMLRARSTDELVTASRALDRVLMSGRYVIPLYHLPKQWLARWPEIERPSQLSLYGALPETWWRKEARP